MPRVRRVASSVPRVGTGIGAGLLERPPYIPGWVPPRVTPTRSCVLKWGRPRFSIGGSQSAARPRCSIGGAQRQLGASVFVNLALVTAEPLHHLPALRGIGVRNPLTGALAAPVIESDQPTPCWGARAIFPRFVRGEVGDFYRLPVREVDSDR